MLEKKINSEETMRSRAILILISLLIVVGFLGFQLELNFPRRPSSIDKTYTPLIKSPSTSVGSYDVLGYVVESEKADRWLQTEKGRQALSPDHGAVKVTQDLIDLGRDALFMQKGLMANTPGLPVAAQLNGMSSAFQNTLAPSPHEVTDIDTLKRGAAIFQKAKPHWIVSQRTLFS
ncbi:hypothetical protein [Fischerella thermalis]|uniref:hypothetical protein n=1 Tax=Fischerella thermalis TaxID=372787 RepID=UPI002155DAFE|nr:hypothetical protein [Fischerella thermalis]